MTESSATGSPPSSRASLRGFGARLLLAVCGALAALLIGLATLVLVDRSGAWPLPGPPPHFVPLEDPRDPGRPRTDAAGHVLYAIDPAAAVRHGEPDVGRYAMTREKAPAAFRILSIGESTTFGAGYAPNISYSRFLEERLRRQLGEGGPSVEVVNCGKNGYDSHDWLTLASELRQFAPDLLILYVGHNELKKPNLLGVMAPGVARLARSRLLQRLLGPPRDAPLAPPAIAVGRFLTTEQRTFACRLFCEGVHALLAAANDLRIRTIVCLPASNVADTRPRYSILQPGDGAASRLARVETAGRDYESGALQDLTAATASVAARTAAAAALAEVDAALALEPDAAILHYRRARLLLQLGQRGLAHAAFERSLALDDLPERASPDLIAALRELAVGRGVDVVPLQPLFDAVSVHGVAGFDLFYDYCHPRLRGHWLIADALLAAVRDGGLIAPLTAFDAAREPAGGDAERFAAWCGELGVSEAQSGQQLLAQARAYTNQIGTRPEVPHADWAIVREIVEAALRMAPELADDPFAQFLGALLAADAADPATARMKLLALERRDPATLRMILDHLPVLPGLQATLHGAGISIEQGQLRWDGKP